MFETLMIGTSGLLSHAKGLKVVGNNLANVNTPGFKSSQLQFAEMFEQGGGARPEGQKDAQGRGVSDQATRVMFRAGTDQSTGNALDLAIGGNGFFVVKRDGQLLYSRAGQFEFNGDNVLVNARGDKVQTMDSSGRLADIGLADLEHSLPKATSTVKVGGILTTVVANPPVNATLNGVTVIAPTGVANTVNLTFTDAGSGNYTVKVADGATGNQLGIGTIKFANGFAVAGSSTLSFNYTNVVTPAFAVQLDFSAVQNNSQASQLSMSSQDGYSSGVRVDQTIAADGTVTVRYSNGQTAKGPRVALADFQSASDLSQVAGGFEARDGAEVKLGYAGDGAFGKLQSGHLEGSNVDLAEEFGNLILMQRGYQASSHVISTANDMIQQLFDMKGNR
ncbi:MAG TPA: flagellar hook-basal body complex protein [Pseudoduganella sp.]